MTRRGGDRFPLFFALAGTLLAAPLAAEPGANRGRARLTLYRTRPLAAPASGPGDDAGAPGEGFALVTERRRIQLAKGVNEVELRHLPARLDPTTVQLRSLTDPEGTAVLEQRFVNDLASTESALNRARGGLVEVQTAAGAVRGVLRAHDPTQLVIDTGTGGFPLRLVPRRAILGVQIGGRVAAEPTLRLKVRARRAARHEVELRYRTGGLSWTSAYTAIYSPRTDRVDLSAVATLANGSGAAYRDADVRLVDRAVALAQPGSGATAPSETVRAFGLPRRADLGDGETVQLELFPRLLGRVARTVHVYESVPRVPYTPGYPNTDCTAYAQPTSKQSARYLEIDGGPKARRDRFPPGKVRVFRRGGDGALELVSEEPLERAPGSGAVRIRVGTDSVIRSRRKQLECRVDDQAREMREKIELTLENRGPRPVQLIVREPMNRWPSWIVESESRPGRATRNAQEWTLRLAAGASEDITYTALYSW